MPRYEFKPGGGGSSDSHVVHGDDANLPRPNVTGPVFWYGSVDPVNSDDTKDVTFYVASDGTSDDNDEDMTWWLGTNALRTQGGTVTQSTAGSGRYITFDFSDSASTSLVGTQWFPAWVGSVNVDLYCTTQVATPTGNVRWRFSHDTAVPGADMDAPTQDILMTVPAPATDVLTVIRCTTAATLTNGFLNERIARLGADAADTMTGLVQIIGLKFTVASVNP